MGGGWGEVVFFAHVSLSSQAASRGVLSGFWSRTIEI